MDYRIWIFVLIGQIGLAQTSLNGTVKDRESDQPLQGVEVILPDSNSVHTDENGIYSFNIHSLPTKLIFQKEGYQIIDYTLRDTLDLPIIYMQPVIALNTIQLQAHRKKEFALRRMQDVEGTSIIAGKKNEVVLLDQITANVATNNARQIFGQVVGLNIFDYNDGGLQLAIGGRGLNPNRSANFNTRQNGYDISADVLGYPESYYTPPAEALKEIQVIRGAASLQYGTQFGGMINFKFKEPPSKKKFTFRTRNTLGSNNLYTNFTSIGGTVNKLGYYAFVNYKNGSSFRPNSDFESINYFGHLDYSISDKTKVAGEFTHFHYLAQQAGGLTDAQFEINPNYSNRERNWFQVDWNLFDINIEHEFNSNSKFSTHVFGLHSERDALGFRSNRVSQEDEENQPRDLLIGEFRNWGFESRFLQNYQLFKQNNVFLLGAKLYSANNEAEQGPGTRASDADFSYDYTATPNYPYQSKFDYPNRNLAVFAETIVHMTNNFSITPGIRYEWINTKAEGQFKEIELDLAGNILYERTQDVDIENNRSFALMGVGLSYKRPNIELYSNISENYRSVTFSDIHVTSPNRFVADDIEDEKGYTFDLGMRGNIMKYISYDMNGFVLLYNNRIGNYIRNSDGKRGRDNIGKATIYGLELFADIDVDEVLQIDNNNYSMNWFVNSAFTHSEYDESNVQSADVINGNQVEYVPEVNFKTGIGFGYKNFTTQWMLSYMSKQYTDAGNTDSSPDPINGGIKGPIPAYSVMDLSLAYRYKRYKVEGSINNLLDNNYFVRRADGYPGPGIIPSEPLNWVITFEIKL